MVADVFIHFASGNSLHVDTLLQNKCFNFLENWGLTSTLHGYIAVTPLYTPGYKQCEKKMKKAASECFVKHT